MGRRNHRAEVAVMPRSFTEILQDLKIASGKYQSGQSVDILDAVNDLVAELDAWHTQVTEPGRTGRPPLSLQEKQERIEENRKWLAEELAKGPQADLLRADRLRKQGRRLRRELRELLDSSG